MRAVRMHQHGGPEVLRIEELPQPKPRPGWSVVRVKACALNHLDLWVRRGLPGIAIPLPHILGCDIAGELVATTDEQAPASGTRVLVAPGVGCGSCSECSAGRDNLCRRYTLLGYLLDGGYAELALVPTVNLIPIPDALDWAAAAAVPLVFLTAWHMLTEVASLRPGETILIQGAGSGVGSAAIQIARLMGARVLATTSDPNKQARARELGAEAVYDSRAPALAAEVRRWTGNRGVEVVFEHVGAATWNASVAALARRGRLVTCGATSGVEVQLDLRHLFGRQLVLAGSYMGGRGELHRVLELVFAGRLAAVIDRTFPLEQAAAAHRHLESGRQFGKVVLMT
jgi:NADPH:quinone reductase-like Zn-dependent oxidoreductase